MARAAPQAASTLPALLALTTASCAVAYSYSGNNSVAAGAYCAALPIHGVPGTNQERTFLAVKPDGVQRGLVGDIIARFEKRGYKVSFFR